MPLVHEVDLVALVGNNKEEAALLGGRESIGNNVELDSHEGNVVASCDVGHAHGYLLELGNSDDAVIAVEIVALGASAA